MSSVATINLDDAPVVVEKRGCGRPRGSKNKVKTTTAASLSTAPGKRHRGCPLGSKNKKPSAMVVAASTTLDLGLAQPILPQRSFGNIFCLFAFTDAQCREHQRLHLKFAEFMDDHKISQAILRETSSGGPPYELEVRYDGDDNVCNALPFAKGRTPVLSAVPWISR
jgi:hypothetical protein